MDVRAAEMYFMQLSKEASSMTALMKFLKSSGDPVFMSAIIRPPGTGFFP